jgi:ADP-ribose pyrophosphatase YjhB (NUDIX family)
LILALAAYLDVRDRRLRAGRPEFRYCPNCRKKLKPRLIGGKSKLACPRCAFVYWNNPIPVVSVLVPSKDGKRVYLVKRAIPPKVGMWALPGGFLEPREGPEAGGIREVKEETGLDVEIERFLAMWPVPHVNEILIFYLAKPTDQVPTPSDETSEVTVFSYDNLPAEIAFVLHKAVIDRWADGVRAASAQ